MYEKLLGSWLPTVILVWIQMTVYGIDNTIYSGKAINYGFIRAIANLFMVSLMTQYLRLTLDSGISE